MDTAARADQHRVDALVKVSMAMKRIEQCQLCGKKDHLARQCTGLSRSLRRSIRSALHMPDCIERAEPQCATTVASTVTRRLDDCVHLQQMAPTEQTMGHAFIKC